MTASCLLLLQQVGTTDLDEKRTNILNELYQTEKSYLTVLELISQDFYSSLVDHITSEDTELLFSAVKVNQYFKFAAYDVSSILII
jgi:hypothetical protein